MDRRSFLKRFVAVSGLTILPATLLDLGLPRIVGDGAHDDTLGLQAALDGKPFACPSGLVYRESGCVFMRDGNFKISASLYIREGGVPLDAKCSIFVFGDDAPEDTVLFRVVPSGLPVRPLAHLPRAGRRRGGRRATKLEGAEPDL